MAHDAYGPAQGHSTDEPVAARRRSRGWGVALVVAAAALWGTDGVFRRGLALELPAATVVFWEHVILVALTAPALVRGARAAVRLSAREWIALLLIGAGASATATALFTAAFRYGDPTTPLLLQKLQPVFALVAAWLLLGERLRPRFAPLALAAVAGAWLITFADPLQISLSASVAGALAIGAAALWAMGTVLGRHMTAYLPPGQITALRFGIGMPTAAVLVLVQDGVAGFAITGADVGPLVLLSLVPGLLALTIYYRGLAGTPASLATLAELAFPLSAIVLNYLVFATTITATQLVGIVLLAGVLIIMSQRAREAGPRSLGVVDRSARPAPA